MEYHTRENVINLRFQLLFVFQQQSGLWKLLQCLSKVTGLSPNFLQGGKHRAPQYQCKEKKQGMGFKFYQEITALLLQNMDTAIPDFQSCPYTIDSIHLFSYQLLAFLLERD